MATIIRKMITITSILFLTTFFHNHAVADRIKKKIYIDLETESPCFRILNGTHEVGCTSSMAGNVGTVHYIQDDSDFDWILSKGPHDPYVALMNGSSFTGPNVRRLYKSSRVVGILVINTINSSSGEWPTDPWPEEGFSSQDKCPNDFSGMYAENPDYNKCKKGDWNTAGSSLGRENINIPMFALTSDKDVDNVLNKCYYPFNHGAKTKSTGYPVCAAEVKSRMDAAVDSRTCIRRTNTFMLSLSATTGRFCDPLGDFNVAATMMEEPDKEPRKSDSVVVMAARVDSASLFMNQYKSADTSVAGIVTMLASAEALWKVKDAIRSDPNAKDIMYTFFQGETFDYIGSSRMVYEMKKKNFPAYSSDHSAKEKYLPKVGLDHIDQILEVNQVGLRDDGNSLWAHSDPSGRAKVGPKVDEMVSDLTSFGKDQNVSIGEPDKNLPLPPASAQSFLKRRLDIPTIVLTDHKKAYTNKFYASRFDRASFINADDYPANSTDQEKYDYVTKQAELITGLSSSIAQYLYKASTGKEPTDEMKQNMTADSSTVTHLLYCFMISPNCELFVETMSDKDEHSLRKAKAPFSFYVSVSDRFTNEVTMLIRALMARFTGQKLDLTSGHCKRPSGEKRFTYTWMAGQVTDSSKDKRTGWCYRSTVFFSEAKSPAFIIDGYDMTLREYSTWTESIWGTNAMGVRLFLIPSPELQLLNLCTGLILLLASLALIFFLNNSADLIFTSPSLSPQAV